MGRSTEGRRRIVEAAARVFQEEGYQTATMAAVAEAAGVSKGLPYHYFESKADLARAVVERHLLAILEELSGWPEGPPEERLGWFVETALGHAKANQESYRLYLSLALQPATRELVLGEVARHADELAGLDAELARIFEAYGHDDPASEAVLLRATVDGLIQYLLMHPEGFVIDAAVEGILARRVRRTGVGA